LLSSSVIVAKSGLSIGCRMTEVIPIPVTSLFPLVLLPLLSVMSSDEVAEKYMNDTIFLYALRFRLRLDTVAVSVIDGMWLLCGRFVGLSFLVLAMQRWGLHKRVALRTLLLVGRRPAMLVLGFTMVTAVISMFLSNSATAVLMVGCG
jgi:solute carrier family 13 (sodium-dependent dicarboxylate transporter), member 2/3/5